MYLACFLLLLGVTTIPIAWAQAPKVDSAPPLLTLDEAVRIASGKNRDVRISALDVTKAGEKVAQARTNYWPKLDAYVLAGTPLNSVDFTFPAGTFGVFPATGPIPATESFIRTPQQLSAFVFATATQPLSDLYKIRLAVQQARLGSNLSREGVRAQQQETRRQVKVAYYQIAQSQAQVEGAKAAVQHLMELSTITERRLVTQTVLASDSLIVKAKLKQQRYQLVSLQDALEVQKQSLNRLLGRDLRTPFSVEMQPIVNIAEFDLETARKQALEQHPEVREARLQTAVAQMDVRRARAEYIPDLGLQAGYLSFQNINFLPQNTGFVAFLFRWQQPWDWGYKKHRVAELRSVSDQKSLTEQDAEQRVLLDVEDKFRKLRQARMLLEAQTDARNAEQVKLKEVTNRYTERAVLLSDLLQQEATVSQAEAQYQQAFAGYWSARAEFEKAIGFDL
jgi:outer membrane protein TolC